MKKSSFFKSLPFKLLVGVVIGILAGLALNANDGTGLTNAILNIIVTLKYVLGQIISFCVPLIIIGFIAPSITKMGNNASRLLLLAVCIAYVSSVGAALFSTAAGYALIPHLSIVTDVDGLKELPEMVFELSIPQIMPVMSALVFSIMIGLAATWNKAKLITGMLEEFQKIVLSIVSRILIPILPLFIGFTSAGLPLGVTFSFLISSPMVDLGSLVLLMSIFGWKVAVLYVIFGLVIAVAGGTLIEKLHLDNQVEEYIRNGHSIDVPQEELHFKDRMKFAWEQVVETAKKVAPYVLIGVGIGAFIHNWIPEEFIVKALGENNPFGVILATIVGIPMYADIFGTIPIAEALLAKGALLGVVLSFMMGVTTLSLPSIIMLRKAVKPKLLGIFIGICAAGIIIVGYLFNAIQYLIV